MNELPPPVRVLGVGVHAVAKESLLDILGRWATEGIGRRVYYVNSHAMNLSYENPAFRQSLNSADLVFCDGFGVKWGARLLGHHLPERMTPPDWIDALLNRLPSGHSIYLLGDSDPVVRTTARLMQARHRHLRVSGSHHGFFDVDGEDNRAIVDEINASDAQVLLVGMGMPRQEHWIDSNLPDLKVSLAISVGAMFRYYSGVERRGPSWMTDRGLEWLTRLIFDPRRLARRYLAGNVLFALRLLQAALQAPSGRGATR